MKTALTTVKASKKSRDTSLLWVEKTLVISCCGQWLKLPSAVVSLLCWCLGELNWLFQSPFQMNDPFLNNFPDIFDPFLFCFNTGCLKFHKAERQRLDHVLTSHAEESWSADECHDLLFVLSAALLQLLEYLVTPGNWEHSDQTHLANNSKVAKSG